ncbi:S-layer homology domain-containing protein [Paenibacillus baimaensis]
MITRNLRLQASGQMYFDDVPQHAWYAQAVAAAVEAGLIIGESSE